MNRALLAALGTLVAEPAFAEVSDKLPTITDLWLFGSSAGALIVGLCRLRLWAATIAVLLCAGVIYATVDMLIDPFVGPAIIKEQGAPFVVAAWGSAGLCVLATLVALALAVRRNRASPAS